MLVTGPAPLAVDGVAVGHGLPRRTIPLNELRAILLHPATSRQAHDAVWRHVLTEAHAGSPAWVIGAVGLALPALWRIAGDLAEGYRGEAEELHAALLAGFVDALHRVDTARPAISTRLRWAAYRAALLARYTRQGIPPMPLPRLESAPPPRPWSHPDLLLADAVAKGVLSPLAAELIGRSRLEDMTLKQAAAELGVGVQAAYKARQRGERRLVAAITSGDVEHQISQTRMSNPGPISGLFLVRGTDAHPRPDSGSRPGAAESEPGAQTAGVRGRSPRSDGTPDTESPAEGGEAFCGPAPQSPPSTPLGTALDPATVPVPVVLVPIWSAPPPRSSRTGRARWFPGNTMTRPMLRPVDALSAVAAVLLRVLTTAALIASTVLVGAAEALAEPPQDLNTVINNITRWLVGLLVSLATLFLTVGGIRYLLAGGDPGEVSKAKDTLKYAAIGYGIAVLAPVLVNILKGFVGG